jgi:diacylglycerol kinase family enzyme
MRATLLHNPSAGAGSPTGDELMAWLDGAGYAPSYQSTEEAGFARALERPGEIVVVAGGDGTVAAVVRLLAGRGVPLGIVPLGTANNIAWSLGVPIDPRRAVAALRRGATRRLDVAAVDTAWGRARFVESAGLGLFASVLRDAERDEARSREDAGARDLVADPGRRMRRVLEREPAAFRRVSADGADLSGEYFLVAVFNTPFIGPRLALAPLADPGDGHLDLLLLRDTDRERVARFLDGAQDPAAPFPVPTIRCRRVELQWDAAAGHLDDAPWPVPPARARASSTSPAVIAIAEPVAVVTESPPPA